MTGLLPKYTAGKRSRLGKTFYFNWDLEDDVEKGMFYPRWNPLCDKNMPTDIDEKEAYINGFDAILNDYTFLQKNTIVASNILTWENEQEKLIELDKSL